jgi:hypothetical protein
MALFGYSQFNGVTAIMPQFKSNSLEPDVSDALHAALGSIRYAKSMTTAYGKNSVYARLQKITDELKDILGEAPAAAPTFAERAMALLRQPMQSR